MSRTWSSFGISPCAILLHSGLEEVSVGEPEPHPTFSTKPHSILKSECCSIPRARIDIALIRWRCTEMSSQEPNRCIILSPVAVRRRLTLSCLSAAAFLVWIGNSRNIACYRKVIRPSYPVTTSLRRISKLDFPHNPWAGATNSASHLAVGSRN
ncbi:hypothetical protein BDM02DRAFT_498374 [Thelephora ganbajun]|uniref:Uncharacterized protein n=1 Tax=Thelephora ganbajun TaxID=370292 RepID=A0ACB6Z773_THEGA|nr:hypothetical protein BDM02DRAFT_498374 [Thelephora ganbajun]